MARARELCWHDRCACSQEMDTLLSEPSPLRTTTYMNFYTALGHYGSYTGEGTIPPPSSPFALLRVVLASLASLAAQLISDRQQSSQDPSLLAQLIGSLPRL